MVPDKHDNEATNLLASIVESSNDAIIGKTLDGVITSWNKGAEEIYGYRVDEVIGKPINILVPPGYPDDIPQIMEKIGRGERVVHYETVRMRKDGKEIYVSVTVSPIKDEKGRIIGASTIARDISLRKSQEAALRASEEKYRRIVDLSEEGIFVLDENDTVTFANKKLAELLGYSIGEIIGKNITSFMAEEDKGCIESVKRKLLEGHVIQFDFRFRRKDGSYIWTIVPTSPIFDKEHHYVGALYMISDLTEHKRIEEALRLSEARYRAIVDSQIELICRSGPDFTLTFANDAFCKYFGIKCSEVTRYNFLDFIPKEDHNKFKDRVALLSSLKPSITIDSQVTVSGGEIKWQQWVHIAIFDNLGRFIELQSVGRDITERKRSEEALRESEASLARSQAIAHLGSWEVDVSTNVVRGSDELYRMFNLEPDVTLDAYVGKMHPEDRAWVVESINAAIYGGKPYSIDYRIVPRPGEVRYVHAEGEVTRDENGLPVKFFGTVQDITERKRVEEDRKRLLHDLGERVKELTALYGIYGIIQKGRSVPEGLQDITDILPSAWQYPEVTAARIIFDGRDFKTPNFLETPWKQRADFHTADGKHGAIEVYYLEEMRDEVEGPFSAEERDLINSLAETVRIYLDKWYAEKALTDAKAQAELYMDLMGHDINNLNQIALGYLELAIDVVKDDEVKEIIKKPLDAIQNSSKLIENVRKLQKVKTGGLKIEAIDLDGLLVELRGQYLNVPGKDVTIDYTPCRDCHVMANRLLRDVFSNLIGNAIKHSGPTKSVRIGLGLDRVKEDGREYCRVTVEDHGPGIPDTLKEKMFEKFHKENVKAGSRGLGLYLVKSLLDDFHGTVRVEDRVPGDYTRGARFVVMLPVAG